MYGAKKILILGKILVASPGLEPGRPQGARDFKSRLSTNSNMRPLRQSLYRLIILATRTFDE